jgi:hypothetical protein
MRSLGPGAGQLVGHDDEGAVQPHHPVHRGVQVVVLEIGAPGRFEFFGPVWPG